MIQTIPFNFEDLYKNAKTIFERTGFDVSEGSNTAQLSAVMAYMIAALNTNTAFNINETLLPYATKRKNILQDARVLGYEPQHKLSYKYRATITIDDKFIGYGTLKIPRYSYVSANGHKYYLWDSDGDGIYIGLGTITIDGTTLNPEFISKKQGTVDKVDLKNIDTSSVYYYVVNRETLLAFQGSALKDAYDNAKNVFNSSERTFEVIEGNVILATNDTSSLQRELRVISNDTQETAVTQYIDIPYNDVEEDGIQCYVSYYDDSGERQQKEFKREENYFFEVNGNEYLNETYLRLDDIEMNTPRVYFQYGGMGTGIPEDSTVTFNLLISSGKDGYAKEPGADPEEEITGTLSSVDGTTNFPDNNGWASNILSGSKVKLDLLRPGSSEESNESIRINAPKVYNSARRLITNKDYQSASNKSTNVRDSSVWGGEEEFPRSPGHIWYSFAIPYNPKIDSNGNKTNFSNDKNKNEYIRLYTEIPNKTLHFKDISIRNQYYEKLYLTGKSITEVLEQHKTKSPLSLSFHHRHPLYLDFFYEIRLLQYNTTRSGEDIHPTLFNVLENCFCGDDLKLERFEAEYFHNNIVKRLDYTVSDRCGIECNLKTKICLNEKTLCTENWNRKYKDIYIPLSVPFEKYFNSENYLDVSRLPSIDTKNFLRFWFEEPETKDPNGHAEGEKVAEYNLVSGDLYTDWSYIEADQIIKRKQGQPTAYTKMFIAPVKISMQYRYRIEYANVNSFKLGFKLAPDNTKDPSFKNIQVLVYRADYHKKFNQYPNTLSENYKFLERVYCDGDIKDLKEYIRTASDDELSDTERANLQTIYNNKQSFTSNFTYNDANRETLTTSVSFAKNNIVEIRFERTCGYYYLFNGFEKKILVHLFVNGDYCGFDIAAEGMKGSTEYDVLPQEVFENWSTHESKIDDDTLYNEITYSDPRSYLYTTDRQYLTCIEPTGEELEEEKFYFSYNPEEEGRYINPVSKQIRDELLKGKTFEELRNDSRWTGWLNQLETMELGVQNGHYLTTEGFYLDDGIVEIYTGPLIRRYNEAMYLYSPLTADLFRQEIFLDVNYKSMNFKVQKNVIPRLRNVKFINASAEEF